VEYRKLVSGVFVSELANKYIQVDCRFGSTMAGTLPGGLSPNRYMAFMVMAPSHGGLLEAPEPLNIVVLKDLADTVFSLKHGDSLRIKGRAVEVIARRGAGNAFRNLIVEANLIEKPQ
jgi:hypothetical protein